MTEPNNTVATEVDDMFELMDISVDIDARDKGAWIEKNRIAPGLVLQVLGFDSPRITAIDIALTKERPDTYGEDREATVDRNRYENRRKCEAGVMNWKPFAWKGEIVEYSEATKKSLLRDPRFEKFLLAAMDAMRQADNITIKWEKAAEKNSAAGSDENSGNDATAGA